LTKTGAVGSSGRPLLRLAEQPDAMQENVTPSTPRPHGKAAYMNLYDCIGIAAVIVAIFLLVVLLNTANARARARMTPKERAELDKDVRRFEQEW
jgi:hypothetical protein